MDEILGSRGWPKDVLPRLFPGRRPWHVRSLGLFRRHEALILSDGHIRVIFRTNHRVCDWISVVRFFNSWTGHICRRIRFVSRRVLLQLVVVNLYLKVVPCTYTYIHVSTTRYSGFDSIRLSSTIGPRNS